MKNTIIITEAMAQAYAQKAAKELSDLLGTNETPNIEMAYEALKEIAFRAIEKAITKPVKSQEDYLPNGEEA
jgi:ribosomal protein L18